MASLGVVEKVASIDAGESPVESGLVFVMPRAELGEFAFPFRVGDGVEVGTEIRLCVLGDERDIDPVTGDRNCAGFDILFGGQLAF